MLLVGLSAAAMAKWVWHIQLQWLWCGARLWIIGVLEKLLLAATTVNPLIFRALKRLPHSAFVILGSCYGGSVSGVTEVGTTLVAGLLWRRLAHNERRAVGIGLGAGAFEAAYLGVMAMVGSELMVSGQAGFGVSALIPPVERVIVIACHVAARAMTLYAVATGRWSWFWGGFALFSALDGLYTSRHLNNTFHTTNPWWIELSPVHLAFPVMAVVLVLYLWRHWPSQANKPLQALVAATGGPRRVG
jgi:hypothetical protein